MLVFLPHRSDVKLWPRSCSLLMAGCSRVWMWQRSAKQVCCLPILSNLAESRLTPQPWHQQTALAWKHAYVVHVFQ